MTWPQDVSELTDNRSMVLSVQNCLTFWYYCIQVVGRLLGAMWLAFTQIPISHLNSNSNKLKSQCT